MTRAGARQSGAADRRHERRRPRPETRRGAARQRPCLLAICPATFTQRSGGTSAQTPDRPALGVDSRGVFGPWGG